MKKDLLIGVLCAIIATFVGAYLYIQFVSPYTINQFIANMNQFNLFGKVLSLAALLNLGVFFLFIRKKEDQKAKGVLLATIILAVFLALRKFF